MTSPTTPAQIVAINMRKARLLRNLSQLELAELLTTATQRKWTQVAVCQAEGSPNSNRIRAFAVDELFALAAVLQVPVTYLLQPPDPTTHTPQLAPETPDTWTTYNHLLHGSSQTPNHLQERITPLLQALINEVATEPGATRNKNGPLECG